MTGDKFDLFLQARGWHYGSRMRASAKRRRVHARVGALALGACWLSACTGGEPAPASGNPTNVAGAGQGGAAGAGGQGGGGASSVGGAVAGQSMTTGGAAAGSAGTPSSLAGAGGAAGSATAGAGGGQSEPVNCPSSKLPAGDTDETLQVGGDSRNYVLHVPAAYDGSKPVPLIIDFHPLSGSGPSERAGSPYPAQTDAEGLIMAFPSGKQGPSGGAWNVGPCCVASVDDVAFAKALVSKISESACVDAKRVYAVGFSMGGGMSHYLACHAADVFAAVAPAAFDLLEENVDDCQPSRPLSIVAFRGTSDPVVPYAGGYSAVVPGMPITFLGAEATFDKWAELNECSGAPSAEDDKGCSTYSSCKAGVEVTLCTDQGGGHDQGNAAVGWPRLKKYQLP